MYRIGTAGWTLPKLHAHHFTAEGSHLERNAGRFACVEINSSFHRAHRRKTWERWAATTPAEFRFAVKIPKTITHTAKLVNTGALLQTFLDECRGLGEKLGPLLVQMPPKQAYDEGVAHEFFTTLRELHPDGSVVLEPRHATWFAPEVDRFLRGFDVSRAAADPPKGSPLAARPGGSLAVQYWRLHGAPRTYYSEYSAAFLKDFAKQIKAAPARASSPQDVWVIFDNTALGHATANALELQRLLSRKKAVPQAKSV